MESVQTAGWVVLAIIVAYFVLPPILIFTSQHFPKVTRLIPFDDDRKLPRGIGDYCNQCRQSLTALGFESVGRFALPNPVPNVQAFVELFINRRDQVSAMATCCFGVVESKVVQEVCYSEFVSRFRHGEFELIQTNDLNDPGAFPAEPLELTFRFPTVHDLSDLYGLHRQLVERHAGHVKAYLRINEEFGGDPQTYLQAVLAESYARQEDRGWFRSDDAAEVWRPTTLGACRMTWQELWPFKSIRRARIYSQARKLLTELRPDLL